MKLTEPSILPGFENNPIMVVFSAITPVNNLMSILHTYDPPKMLRVAEWWNLHRLQFINTQNWDLSEREILADASIELLKIISKESFVIRPSVINLKNNRLGGLSGPKMASFLTLVKEMDCSFIFGYDFSPIDYKTELEAMSDQDQNAIKRLVKVNGMYHSELMDSMYKAQQRFVDRDEILQQRIGELADKSAVMLSKVQNLGEMVGDVDDWQKNHNLLFEEIITHTVRDYEMSHRNQPGEVISVYKKGTILQPDGVRARCQIDGLFQRNDKTWVVCEAKTHLRKEAVDDANKTIKSFETYLEEVRNFELPGTRIGMSANVKRYWNQVTAFQDLLAEDKTNIVKYLGYKSCEKRINAFEDPVQVAMEYGFTLVEPTKSGYVVSPPNK